MAKCTLVASVAIGIALLQCQVSRLGAWEATYQTGPVKKEQVPLFEAAIAAAAPPPPIVLGHQRVAYPAEEGASLGQGWDLLLSRGVSSKCIVFDEKSDNYQNADESINYVVDEESLDVALNLNFSGSARGSIYVYSGNAKSTIQALTTYHYASKDQVFVARADIGNGIHFVEPPKEADVHLTPAMNNLRKNDLAAFRRMCGDGFVQSIYYGAGLYLVLHFHDVDQKTSVDINSAFKGHVGVGDIFGASGESKVQTVIKTALNKSQLDIEFRQDGGILKTLPIDLATAKQKVIDLPGEANNGPKPISMIIVPYSELPGEDALSFFAVVDKRQKAIRYYDRLVALFYEVTEIEKDYYRQRTADNVHGDKYYYSYRHLLRPEDIVNVRTTILNELRMVSTIIRDLDGKDCDIKSDARRCGNTTPANSFDGTSCKLVASDPTCQSLNVRSSQTDFDDLKFWLLLPLPNNTIPADDRMTLEGGNLEEKKRVYTSRLFHHWIERVADVRSKLFNEPMTDADRTKYRDDIAKSFMPVAPALVQIAPADVQNPNIDYGVWIAPGFSAWISIGNNEPSKRAVAFSLFRKERAAPSWEAPPLANNVRGYGQQYKLEATPNGFGVGEAGIDCNFWGIGSGCARRWFAKGFSLSDPLTANIRYYDAGETQVRNWNLEVKIEAVPDPAFR